MDRIGLPAERNRRWAMRPASENKDARSVLAESNRGERTTGWVLPDRNRGIRGTGGREPTPQMAEETTSFTSSAFMPEEVSFELVIVASVFLAMVALWLY